MPQAKTWLKTDLSKPITVYSLENEMFTLDNQGNMIGVEVYDNGEAVNLTGTIIGYIIRADGDTVYVEGSISGNKATIVLPAVAYAIVGQITIVIRCINGEQKTVIAACKAHVTRSRTDEVIDPGEVIPSIEDLPVVVTGVTTYYQESTSGTIIPTGEWSTTIPSVLPGNYLWQKEVITWNTTQTTDIYTVTRFGADGSGSVSAVSMNGATIIPDAQGVIVLGAVGIVDDAAGTGDTYKVWSADKLTSEVTLLQNAINGKSNPSTALHLTLAAGSWSSATPPTQTLNATGVTATNNFYFTLDSTATQEQYIAAADAQLFCIEQSAGQITIECRGVEPVVNIPVLVVILG